jgi:hypothetical protein
LLAGNKYLLTIQVRNPYATSSPNFWRIFYKEYTSIQVEGFPIWTMTRASLTASNNAANDINIVSFLFNPFNAIPVGGFLAIAAPTGFIIDTACTAAIYLSSSFTKKIPTECTGTTFSSNVASIKLVGPVDYIYGGLQYSLILTVKNPPLAQPASGWNITTYTTDSTEGLLDTTEIAGFAITSVINNFEIVSASSQAGLEPVVYQLRFALPTAALPYDEIEIKFPEGFVLNGFGQRSCRGYSLMSVNGQQPPLTLVKIFPVCGGNSFSFLIPGDAIIQASMAVLFSINTVNPVKANVNMNRFVLRHSRTTVSAMTDTTVLGSKSIPGLVIYPKMVNPKILFATIPPLAGSNTKSAISISFIAITGATRITVSGSHAIFTDKFFDFSSSDFSVIRSIPQLDNTTGAVTSFTRGNATVVSHSIGSVVVDTEFSSGSLVNVTLNNVVNCPLPGPSKWTLTTTINNGTDKKDEVRDINGVTIIGKLVVLPTSSISPNTYGGKNIRLTLIFTSNIDLTEQSLVVVTAPSGYKIIDQSFQDIVGLYSSVNGLVGANMVTDSTASGSVSNITTDSLSSLGVSAATENRIYYLQINTLIRSNLEVSFSLTVDAPSAFQQHRSWYLDVYKPPADRSSWFTVGSRMATNDGIFGGFNLVGILPFILYPENLTPGSLIRISIEFRIPLDVVGVNTVSVTVTAPIGFSFSASCFTTAIGDFANQISRNYFISCVGSSNVAVLVSNSNKLLSGPSYITLLVQNPQSVPEVNVWTMSVSTDVNPSEYTNYQEKLGFGIQSMTAGFIGGNRLGAKTAGFFTITLTRDIISTYVQVVISPHAGSGYTLLCEPGLAVGMPAVPVCDGDQVPGSPVTMTVLAKNVGKSMTLGLAMDNPALPVPDTNNYFSIVIRDPLGSSIDANMKIPGMTLKATQISGASLRYDSTRTNSLAMVQVHLTLDNPLQSGSLTEYVKIVITAPVNFVMSSAASVKISSGFVLAQVLPITVAGNTLTVLLDPANPTPPGSYAIESPLMHPSKVPDYNVWLVEVFSGRNLLYLSPLAGYPLTSS